MKLHAKTGTLATALGIAIAASLGSASIAQENDDRAATISADADVLTMVNVLTPQEGEKQATIELLQRGMDEEMSAQPGFISATIHSSRDSDHVVVYAQWANIESVQQAGGLIQAGEAPIMASVFAKATPDFHPYDVVSVHR